MSTFLKLINSHCGYAVVFIDLKLLIYPNHIDTKFQSVSLRHFLGQHLSGCRSVPPLKLIHVSGCYHVQFKEPFFLSITFKFVCRVKRYVQ